MSTKTFHNYAAYTFLLLLLVLFPPNHCNAKQTSNYTTSCGDIHNISFPFMLTDYTNPKCQDNNFTLSCENNRTLFRLGSRNYYVKEIDYANETIRIVDTAINTNVCSSLPLQPFNIAENYLYQVWDTTIVLFLNCEKPVKSPLFIDITTYCDPSVSDPSKLGNYSYVMAGVKEATTRDIGDLCIGETMVLTSSHLTENRVDRKFNLEEVYSELAYGFKLNWGFFPSRGCDECRRLAACFVDSSNPCPGFCYDRSFLRKLRIAASTTSYLLYYALIFGIGPIIAARVLCMPCVFGFLVYKFRRRHLSTFDKIEGFLRSQNNLMPVRYSYRDIKKMSNNFKDKLGEGGYGSVYKGKLRSGHYVAIKMLNKPKADGQEFINEVATIGRIHHVNVVKLIGYSAESSKRALIYDFMPNGSLDKYISSEDSFLLRCEQMYKISLGVARGIEYLHNGCEMQILHFDIKPHNILLDENFVPKVSDFGLAKLYPTEDSIVSLTAARGTMGYMAPELFYKNIGGVSYKADVYSFGMLLMEMAGRRRNWNSGSDSDQVYFPSWVYEQLTNHKEVDMGEMTEEEKEMVKKMMMVALWCVQMNPSNRPSMNKIVEMIEGNVESLQMAPRPFFYPEAMSSAKNNGFFFSSSSFLGGCMDSTSLNINGR